jgi:hypothetical protein
MHSHSHPVSYLTVALIVATAFVSTCRAQEVASLDLTKVAVRDGLRRPKATSPVTGGYSGTEQTSPCLDSTQEVGALRTSLVSLDRTHYQLGDEPRFEVTVENAGSTPVRIPFSPQLADLQPENPAQKFSYSKLQITLWIAASKQWGTTSGNSHNANAISDREPRSLSCPNARAKRSGPADYSLTVVKSRLHSLRGFERYAVSSRYSWHEVWAGLKL